MSNKSTSFRSSEKRLGLPVKGEKKMGIMIHHAIIVTCWDRTKMNAAARKARSFGLQVLGPGPEVVNDYSSLLVAPDGSKEGWAESDAGNRQRAEFIAWINAQAYEDGSSPFDWVLVEFGPDMRGPVRGGVLLAS